MDVRKFLHECRGLTAEIASLERQLELAGGKPGPKFRSTSVVTMGSRDNNPTATELHNVDYYKDLLLAGREEAMAMLARLEEMIKQLPGSRTRAIMRFYYGQGLTNERVAEKMDIATETVSRKRAYAVRVLERKFSDDTKCHGMSRPTCGNVVFREKRT